MDGSASHWEAITRGVGAVHSERDIVRVFGVDAEKFLQTQVTQDVTALAPGECRWTFLLEPKGRVEAFLRVWGRHGDSEILLDTEKGSGQKVMDRLNRFRIRTKVELETFRWDCVSLRGPETVAVAGRLHPELMAETPWPGVSGVDMLGPSLQIPEGITEVGGAALELLRIESAWPDMDHEFSPLVQPAPIPGELGEAIVDRSISFTKGCYTGQELVVRTRSRGNNTPRRLRLLRVDEPGDASLEAFPAGASILVAGEIRGVLTSLAARPDGNWVGLGFVHRVVDDHAVGELEWVGASVGSESRVQVKILSPVQLGVR